MILRVSSSRSSAGRSTSFLFMNSSFSACEMPGHVFDDARREDAVPLVELALFEEDAGPTRRSSPAGRAGASAELLVREDIAFDVELLGQFERRGRLERECFRRRGTPSPRT